MSSRFARYQKSLLLLMLGMVLLVIVTATLYMLGMTHLEGDPRTFLESLQFAAETLTTTGYGEDGRWKSVTVSIFVIVLQFLGVFVIFLVIPIYLIPFLEERFELRLPKEAKNMSDHVVIYHYGAPVTTLLAELQEDHVSAVILEEDESIARQALRDGHQVVHARTGDIGLSSVCLDKARALIANSADDKNAAVCLVARQLGFTKDIYAMVEDPFHRKPLALAGATAVFTPRHMLGAALAARASSRISPRVSGIQQLGKQLEVVEVGVTSNSPLVGKSLIETKIGSETGINIIAKWVSGQLKPVISGDTLIEANDVLVGIGTDAHIRKFTQFVGGSAATQHEKYIVAGFGEVGKKVHELLTAVGEEVQVVDKHAGEGVDFVGDALDHRLIERAGIVTAQAVILALDSDSATLFATVVLKDLAPQVRIIARVNHADNVERIHRAGAEFALSISQVAGQIMARRLLGDEAVALNTQLKIQKVSSIALAGSTLGELRIRSRTGCSIVAVERGPEVLVSFHLDFRFEKDDAVFVCGSYEAIRLFHEHFGES